MCETVVRDGTVWRGSSSGSGSGSGSGIVIGSAVWCGMVMVRW